MLAFFGILQNDQVRAGIDIVRADQHALRLSGVFGLGGQDERIWDASTGGVRGRSSVTRWMFARNRMRLITFNHSLRKPFQQSDLGEQTLSRIADRVSLAVIPKSENLKIISQALTVGSEWDPPSFTRNLASTNGVGDVRKLLIKLERATGRPVLVMIAYKDKRVAEVAVSGRDVLTLKFGTKTIPPP